MTTIRETLFAHGVYDDDFDKPVDIHVEPTGEFNVVNDNHDDSAYELLDEILEALPGDREIVREYTDPSSVTVEIGEDTITVRSYDGDDNRQRIEIINEGMFVHPDDIDGPFTPADMGELIIDHWPS